MRFELSQVISGHFERLNYELFLSWANLEKHLQWHEEMDNAPSQPNSEQEQETTTQQSDNSATGGQFNLRTKNLANLSPSQLKLLKESLGSSNTTHTSVSADESKKHDELKSELDRMEMSDSEGKMSESEN